MKLSNFLITEILFIMFCFSLVLGITVTLFGLLFSRKLKYSDARKRLRYENLKKFRSWMVSYREILKCQYPSINSFWLSQAIAPTLRGKLDERNFDIDQATTFIHYLREYKSKKQDVDKAYEVGEEALESLVQPPSRLNFKARKNFSKEFYNSGTGLPPEIIDDLQKFHTLFDFLYNKIEKKYAGTEIDWDKLDTLSPHNLHKIVLLSRFRAEHGNVTGEKYHENYSQLTDALDEVYYKKRQASEHLENIFSVIRKYENEWIVPER